MQHQILQIRQQIRSIDRKIQRIPQFITTRPLYSCRSTSPSIIRLRSRTPMHVSAKIYTPRGSTKAVNFTPVHTQSPKLPISLVSSQQKEISRIYQQSPQSQKQLIRLQCTSHPESPFPTIKRNIQRQLNSLTFQGDNNTERQSLMSDRQRLKTKDEDAQTENLPDVYYAHELSNQAKEIIEKYKDQNRLIEQLMNYNESEVGISQGRSSSRATNGKGTQLQKITHQTTYQQTNSNPYGLISRQSPQKAGSSINNSASKKKKKTIKQHVIHYDQIFLSKPRINSAHFQREESQKYSSLSSTKKQNTNRQQQQQQQQQNDDDEQIELKIINMAPQFSKMI